MKAAVFPSVIMVISWDKSCVILSAECGREKYSMITMANLSVRRFA